MENPLNLWSLFCGIYPKIARTRKKQIHLLRKAGGRLPQTIADEEGKCMWKEKWINKSEGYQT